MRFETGPPDNTGRNIDPITGAQIQFAQYLSEYHPEIAADQLAQKDATSRLNEILNSASSNPRVSQYQKWLADFQKGIDNNVFHNGTPLPFFKTQVLLFFQNVPS
jgi:hypothetical protein